MGDWSRTLSFIRSSEVGTTARARVPMQCLCEMRVQDLTLGEAARALNVSADTLRRWDRSGKLRTVRDERNRRRVPASEPPPPRGPPPRHETGHSLSARNRFPGIVK